MKFNQILFSLVFISLFFSIANKVEAVSLVATVNVGISPADSIRSIDGVKLYVVNIGNDTVSVIDTNTNQVIKTIQLAQGSDPHFLEISPDGKEVYVTERMYGKVDIITTDNDTVVARMNTYSRLINDLVVSPDGTKLYVASAEVRGTIRMTVIDTVTRKAIDFFDTSDAQEGMVFSKDGKIGYVKLTVNNSNPLALYTNVVNLETKTIIGKVSNSQVGIISPDGTFGWGHNFGSQTVDRINFITNTIINSEIVAARPNKLIADDIADPRYLFVSNDASGKVTILNAETLEIEEVIQTSGYPVGLSVDKSSQKLYVSIINMNIVEIYDLSSLNLWTEIEEKKDMYDLLHELIETVEGYSFSGEIEQSYFANLKKVESFLNSVKYIPAENQIRTFIKKLEQDFKGGKITKGQYDDLYARANAVLDAIPDDAFGTVPLITQVVSPYPSVEETTSWANAVYADGRANTPGSCGRTIAQCGCAVTSLSMVGKYHGIDTGFDGTAVNPLNMNNWLLANGGYSYGGGVIWNYALAYMGEVKNGKVVSKLSLDGYNITDGSTISNFVENGSPSVGFSGAKGHYLTLSGVVGNGYSVNDPAWYNTKTTDDTRDVAGKVQDYNNVIDKANLIGYSAVAKAFPESVEIVLESPAELLVIDEKGRRLGYDMTTGNFWDEIPGGIYDREDFILNPENPASTPHKAKRIYIAKPEGESFVVKVIGTGDGAYHASFAITDGNGGLFGEQVASTTRVGNVDEFTVTTLMGTGALPRYLKDILNLIPLAEQKKFVQAFTVIAGQIEKDHVIPTEHIVEGLIRFIEEKYVGKAWAREVIAALHAMI